MQRNRNGPGWRLGRRAARFAALAVLVLMPFLAGRLRAQWLPFSAPDSVPDRGGLATAYDPVNDRIYMFGGTPTGDYGSDVDLCQRYNPVAPHRDTWTMMAPMLTARSLMSAAYVRGMVYVMGGRDRTATVVADNEEYTIAADSWAGREPLPVAVWAHMTGVWKDSLIYVMGGLADDGGIETDIETVQVYNPFTDSWAIGTPMLDAGSYGGPAAVVGDTIYISNAFSSEWPSWQGMLKGAINPDAPTQITWVWGPRLPEHLHGFGGTLSLRNKVYALGLLYQGTTLTMWGLVYDPATGDYVDSLPNLLLEGAWRLDGQFVVARDAADEIYQIAGTFDYAGGSRYNRLFVNPQGTGEAGPELMPDERLRVSTLFRNGVRIHYEIERPCRVTLTVYDQSGRAVRTLGSGQMQAGSYAAAWDGRDDYGRPAASGVYFCRLQAGEVTAARKMVKTE